MIEKRRYVDLQGVARGRPLSVGGDGPSRRWRGNGCIGCGGEWRLRWRWRGRRRTRHPRAEACDHPCGWPNSGGLTCHRVSMPSVGWGATGARGSRLTGREGEPPPAAELGRQGLPARSGLGRWRRRQEAAARTAGRSRLGRPARSSWSDRTARARPPCTRPETRQPQA